MAESQTGKRRAVLVVEDEPLLRLSAIDMVEDMGFEAVEAADADEAIRILEARPDIIIMFTDIDMPGSIDGMRLAACVRDRWPPIHIIVTSGHARPDDVVLPPNAEFVPKPYRAADVEAMMMRMAA